MDIDLTQVTGRTIKHVAMSMLIVMKRVSQVHSKIERLLCPKNVVTASQSSQRKRKIISPSPGAESLSKIQLPYTP